ncbi:MULTISPECIES: hypothetical protein [Variovorax]|uniref:Uncharacterized protein n=1 Tax=Variovorax guangxiensis TaxID=1775474 RepID=A0A840FJX8_9BURK|nr:hypothetical protein [Variovorax guangxiensis]MBB4220764.1 hypothetical protein [Variovorax guangxiensis]
MSSRYDNKSFTQAKAEPRAPQRRRVHGGSPAQPPMAFDVGYGSAPPAAPARTWRSTVVGIAIGFGIVLAFAMKWLMSYQIDSAEERRVQQKAVRAAAARCYGLVSNAAINACLKDVEAKSAQAAQ